MKKIYRGHLLIIFICRRIIDEQCFAISSNLFAKVVGWFEMCGVVTLVIFPSIIVWLILIFEELWTQRSRYVMSSLEKKEWNKIKSLFRIICIYIALYWNISHKSFCKLRMFIVNCLLKQLNILFDKNNISFC